MTAELRPFGQPVVPEEHPRWDGQRIRRYDEPLPVWEWECRDCGLPFRTVWAAKRHESRADHGILVRVTNPIESPY